MIVLLSLLFSFSFLVWVSIMIHDAVLKEILHLSCGCLRSPWGKLIIVLDFTDASYGNSIFAHF